MSWDCACCTRKLPDRAIENIVVTDEGFKTAVGSDCAKKIVEAGTDGFEHPKNPGVTFYTSAAWKEVEPDAPND